MNTAQQRHDRRAAVRDGMINAIGGCIMAA